MDAVRKTCCGLDVHQENVVACILKGELDQKPVSIMMEFGTTTKELLRLQDWLADHECVDVVMESTGVFWKPIWNVLESTCELVLANPKRVKNIPGRKTDVKDAQWLAKLHRCGLIEGSMVPEQYIRDLRDNTRYRRKLVQTATAEKNRIHKILQDANIKLTTYVSDLFGVSGRALLQKIMDGEVLEEKEVRSLVKSRLKSKVPVLLEALHGKLRLHHRQMIRDHWDHLEFLEAQIVKLEMRIEAYLIPYEDDIARLDTIPGIDRNAAATIFAEIGPDVAGMFPTDAQLSSWAGLSPGNNESAGKKRGSKCPKGNKHLKAVLCQAAMANMKTKNRIGEFLRYIRKRRGEKKASVATAHLILRIIYALMRDKANYMEKDVQKIGGSTSQEKRLAHYLKQIQEMGYSIQLSTQEAAS